ncbi:NAD/NADP octopine/nopaline dehydrogenase family protein [Hespellia stercorisuis]|uniref:Opine dehydrogenase n=1 Tax=Hespellia stercorisuis DSM 15480 TaxID=1121950 RepID=A0A1M6M8F0_9FIRM|nr:NAD/NADP octopine/nopaline dehydrogenase family protein [Hespellia stercorisuis]SHJ79747.1 opine dehydrogenase [Hespellia stercorisuis DSM 15480]
MKQVTVIGGGGTGIMMAADLSLKGHKVTLYEQKEHAKNLEAIQKRGYVDITGNAVNGRAVIAKITTDIETALKDAEIILISLMAQRQEAVMDLMLPYLKNGQTVCFSAGSCASLILKKKIAGKDVLTGEMQGNIYPCRLLADGSLISALPYKEKAVAAFPSGDNDRFAEVLSEVYPCHPVKNVFQATLNSPNTSIHLAGTILGTAKMETMEDFRLYRDGLSPSVAELIGVVEAEKEKVMDRMGYEMGRASGEIKALMQYDQHPQLDIFRGLEGPTGINHRYVTEDAYAGNSLLLSLGRAFAIEMPVLAGLLAIASALNRTDFYEQGRTMERFGLNGMTPEEINRYLETGVK